MAWTWSGWAAVRGFAGWTCRGPWPLERPHLFHSPFLALPPACGVPLVATAHEVPERWHAASRGAGSYVRPGCLVGNLSSTCPRPGGRVPVHGPTGPRYGLARQAAGGGSARGAGGRIRALVVSAGPVRWWASARCAARRASNWAGPGSRPRLNGPEGDARDRARNCSGSEAERGPGRPCPVSGFWATSRTGRSGNGSGRRPAWWCLPSPRGSGFRLWRPWPRDVRWWWPGPGPCPRWWARRAGWSTGLHPGAWGEVLARVLAGGEEVAARIAEGHARARRFTWARAAERLLRLYAAVLQRASA